MITGILLAAGHSTRFGNNKLLEKLAGGMPVIAVTALKLKQEVDHLIAVIKPEDTEIKALLDTLEIETVTCAQSHMGMGHSIACGVAKAPHASAWLIALADMPYIQADTFHTLANLMRTGVGIAAPLFEKRRGHPVGFNKQYFDELVLLTGDQGARAIIERNTKVFRGFTCQDSGVVRDIDFPEDVVIH
jgi:molybdenum cofactor cytidylyltransferase